MARLMGKAGEVDASGAIVGMKNWVLNYKCNPLDDTGFDSGGAKAFIAGLTEWSGTFEGFKDTTPVPLGSTTITLKESATTGQNATGTAIITGWTDTVDVAGVVTYKYTFQGTGALTVPTA